MARESINGNLDTAVLKHDIAYSTERTRWNLDQGWGLLKLRSLISP